MGEVPFAILGLFWLVPSSPSAVEKEILEELRVGHQATIESVQRLSCRITVSRNPKPQGDARPTSCDYWRTPDKLRMRISEGNRSIDAFCHDSRVSCVTETRSNNGELSRSGTINKISDYLTSDLDAWRQGLFTLTAPGLQGPLPLMELLDKHPKLLRRASRESQNGRQFIVLEFANDQAKVEWWFDPSVNYLACKYKGESNEPGRKGTVRTESRIEVTRFAEPVRGLYFPAQVKEEYYHASELQYTKVVTMSNVRVNQPLPPEVFTFRFPPGTLVHDLIAREAYTVGNDGNPVGRKRPLANVSPPPTAATGSLTETREEPGSWTTWILPISALILGVAGGLWLAEKRRRRRKPELA